MRDDFVKTSDPPNTELTGPIESLTNVLAPEAEYRLTTRLTLGGNYSWTHVRYPDRAGEAAADLDRDEHLFGGSVFWKIRPKADCGSTTTTASRTSASRPIATSPVIRSCSGCAGI